jgi:hypothetical protein
MKFSNNSFNASNTSHTSHLKVHRPADKPVIFPTRASFASPLLLLHFGITKLLTMVQAESSSTASRNGARANTAGAAVDYELPW